MLVYALALSVVIGYARGGRLKHYEQRPLQFVALPLLAFIVEALYGFAAARGVAPAVVLRTMVPLQYALLIGFCAANWRRKPIWWIGAGTLSNLLVIGLNGFRMPVSAGIRAVPALARTASRIESGELFEYVIVGADTRLHWLGDVLYWPLPPQVGYASAGDILLAVGMFLLVMEIMRKQA